jgi:hypothetical protein
MCNLDNQLGSETVGTVPNQTTRTYTYTQARPTGITASGNAQPCTFTYDTTGRPTADCAGTGYTHDNAQNPQ